MKKQKIILIGALSMAAIFCLGTPLGAEDTPVTYVNENTIPDPENPTSPEYLVSIPRGIVFTDEVRTVDTSIDLLMAPGKAVFPNKDVKIKVDSLNAYRLKNKSKEVPYNLNYGGVKMSDTVTAVGTLNGAPTTGTPLTVITGNANLEYIAPENVVKGVYNDTLTYTITPVVPAP